MEYECGGNGRLADRDVDQSAVTHVLERAQWWDDCHPGLRLRLRILTLGIGIDIEEEYTVFDWMWCHRMDVHDILFASNRPECIVVQFA